MSSLKRIGILTSGGDCSGLNSAIRAAFIRAKKLGYELIGIKRGLRGIFQETPDYIVLDDVLCDSDLLTKSGSILYSDTKSISSSIKMGITIEDIKRNIYANYESLGLSGLIYVGGDGSLALLSEIFIDNDSLNIVAIPKTIDNDVAETDQAIGFSTAVQVVAGAIENIRSTARSHERTMVIEVMGRDAGFIAMYAGIASGVDAILVPEFKFTMDGLKKAIEFCYASGKDHCLVVVAEAVEEQDFKHKEEFVDGAVKYTHLKYRGIANHIVQQLKEADFEARAVVLGHIQRGGQTSINDRILASAFGTTAVDLIDSNKSGKMICFKNGKIEAIDIKSLNNKFNKKLTDSNICVKIAKELGVYIGEI